MIIKVAMQFMVTLWSDDNYLHPITTIPVENCKVTSIIAEQYPEAVAWECIHKDYYFASKGLGSKVYP